MTKSKVITEPKSKWKVITILVLIILIVSAIVIIPRYNRYVKNRRAIEIRTALEALRGSVDQYWKNNGSISGITVEGSLADAGINAKIQAKWQFVIAWKQTEMYTTEMVDKLKDVNTNQMVYVSPYRMILAVATKNNPLAEGTKLWFVGDTNSYHGFGVDEEVEPDWRTIFPNP